MGVAPADTGLSLLDGLELVGAPPELCTTPERGSDVEASFGEEVEPAWPTTERCTIPDVEPDEELAADADESVDDVGPFDDEPGLVRILMPTRANDNELAPMPTTNHKDWSRRTPLPACSSQRFLRRARPLTHPRGQGIALSPAPHLGDNRRENRLSVH